MADPNGAANNRFWGMLGGASGGALGFIVANVPGLLAGAVAGNRLGAIRDAKGKSVYAVFQVRKSHPLPILGRKEKEKRVRNTGFSSTQSQGLFLDMY